MYQGGWVGNYAGQWWGPWNTQPGAMYAALVGAGVISHADLQGQGESNLVDYVTFAHRVGRR